MAIVSSMSQRTSSTATGRRPVRTLLLILAMVGLGLALRAAVADQGGSYDPADVQR